MENTGEQISEEPVELPPGTKLGKYELVRMLGSGGMGSVYEAVHLGIGKRVAIKTLNPQVAAVPGARARFLREAELTSKVQHPHIVDVTDMGTEQGHTFIVMELLKGEDLAHRLGRETMLTAVDAADIMLPVASAVFTAHQAGIVHRDLKPQNIFLTRAAGGTTHPTVLDFGISKQSDAGLNAALTTTGAMVGTPYYLSPEQIEDARGAGPASDQYALGVILYECLAGRRPYQGESLFTIFTAIVQGQRPPLAALRPDLPPELVAIVDRAMNRHKEARFPSVAALGVALLPFASVKGRLTWEHAFADADGPVPSQSNALPTMALPATPLPPTATRMLPESGSLDARAAISATRSAAFGASATDVRPQGRGKAIAIAVASALAAAGAVAFLATRGSAPTTPAPATAPAAETAVAPPAPPAAAAPAPEPAAPPPVPEPKSAAERAGAGDDRPGDDQPRGSDRRNAASKSTSRRSRGDVSGRPRRSGAADAPSGGTPTRAPNPNGAPLLE